MASLLSILGQVMSQLQSWMSQLTGGNGLSSGAYGGTSGCGSAGASGYGNTCGPTQFAQNVTLSSTGDPHLAETGTIANANGTTANVNTHVNSMTAHSDLVYTNDVRGGYSVSTSVTAPDANGVTYNSSATVTTANGNDAVTMTNGGNVEVTQFGQTTALGIGQTLQLANGETVARNSDGSVTVSERNANGGSISTSLRQNGPGVDVTTQAQNIRIGGDIVNSAGPSGETFEPPRDEPKVRYASELA